MFFAFPQNILQLNHICDILYFYSFINPFKICKMALLHLTDNNFKKEVLESDLLVLVDFWATWCSPCRMVTPIIEELAKEYDKKIKIGKINIDENPKIPTHYGVMSIPTLMFFKKGRVVDQAVGALSKAELKKKIEENLL